MQGDDAGDGEVGDQGEQVQLVLDVEVVRRLVQEEFAGLLGQGACDLDALAFAAGQGVPGLPGAVRETGAPQRVGDGVLVGAVGGGPGAPVRDAAEAYDVQDAEVDLGDRVLVDDGDPAGDGAAAEAGEGAPSRVTTPVSGARRPARIRSRVDFPEPLGPRSPTVEPGGGVMSTPSRMSLPPAARPTRSARRPVETLMTCSGCGGGRARRRGPRSAR